MIVATLVAALLLVTHGVCASRAGNSVPTQDSRLLLLFRDCKAGVLRIREMDVYSHWFFCYDLAPTKESVERIGGLLFEDSPHVPCCHSTRTVALKLRGALGSIFTKIVGHCLGEEIVVGPRNLLVAIMRRQASFSQHYSLGFLDRYVVFRAVLFGGLSKDEAKMLKSISFELPIDWLHWFSLGQLIDDLTGPKRGGDLFIALANNFETAGLCGALSELSKRCPETVTRLTRQYIEGDRRGTVEISQLFFSCLNDESQYRLFLIDGIWWLDPHSLYILSRFSELPPEDAKGLCLSKRPQYLTCEEKAQVVEGNLLVKMDNLDPKRIPKDAWIMILSHNNLLFQIYTIPMVCKFWKDLHGSLLSRSSIVHTAFVKDLENAFVEYESLNCYRRPWNYFLKSPRAFLSYALLCLEGTSFKLDRQTSAKINGKWKRFVQSCRSAFPVSSALYCDLYLRYCRATGSSPKLYQPPGMSDDEYFAFVRNLVAQHKIIPDLPARFLNDDCGKLVQALGDDGSIVALLLRRPWDFSKLAASLFLSGHHAPPAMDKILRERSPLYRFLMDEDTATDERLSATFQEHVSLQALACGIVRLCLTEEAVHATEMLNVLREVSRGYTGKLYDKDMGDPVFRRSVDTILSGSVMVFLCKHCQEYSEEEYRTVERVLGQCGILNSDSKSQAFEACVIAKLFGELNIAVELIQ